MPRQPSFEQAFSTLLDHLRLRPEDDRQTRRLLKILEGTVASEDVTIEAGLVRTDTLSDPGLRGRMLARRVETLRVAATAPGDELLALAQALAVSELEIPSTSKVTVEFVVDIQPGKLVTPSPPPRPESNEIELVDSYAAAATRATSR